MRNLLFLVALCGFFAMAAPPKKVSIQTNAICEMCQSKIEKTLFALEGVKRAELDMVTKKVKIKYDEDLIDVATLRQAIASVGYNADDVPARPKAQAALDACCKPKGDACCADKTKACKKPE